MNAAIQIAAMIMIACRVRILGSSGWTIARYRSAAMAINVPTEEKRVTPSIKGMALQRNSPNGQYCSTEYVTVMGTFMRVTVRSATPKFAIKRLVTLRIRGFRYANMTRALPTVPTMLITP